MSFNIEERYCCLELDGIHSEEQFKLLLNAYSQVIWHNLQETEEHPEHFYSVEEEIPAELEKAVPFITSELCKYVECNGFVDGSASVVVQYEYDSERDDCDLFEELCKFLFAHSSQRFFQITSAAFDNGGSYSHQWIGYRKGEDVVLEYADDFYQRIFQQEQDLVLQAG